MSVIFPKVFNREKTNNPSDQASADVDVCVKPSQASDNALLIIRFRALQRMDWPSTTTRS